jgi:hypothetical protein
LADSSDDLEGMVGNTEESEDSDVSGDTGDSDDDDIDAEEIADVGEEDHKAPAEGREHLGPKLRPVCGAVESSNGPLYHMLSEIFSFLGDRVEVEVGALETYNNRASTTRTPVIFSMDVVAM